MEHKEIARLFLKLAGSGEVQEAYDRFVSPSFIHHNPYFKGDRESLMAAMIEAHRTSPNKSIEIKQALEDGALVATHSLVTRRDAKQSGIAVVHIFRFRDQKIVELWDLAQSVATDSPNENGFF
jgi:predicted SnoaL-like aldol condensation-catalyzing enzyme